MQAALGFRDDFVKISLCLVVSWLELTKTPFWRLTYVEHPEHLTNGVLVDFFWPIEEELDLVSVVVLELPQHVFGAAGRLLEIRGVLGVFVGRQQSEDLLWMLEVCTYTWPKSRRHRILDLGQSVDELHRGDACILDRGKMVVSGLSTYEGIAENIYSWAEKSRVRFWRCGFEGRGRDGRRRIEREGGNNG